MYIVRNIRPYNVLFGGEIILHPNEKLTARELNASVVEAAERGDVRIIDCNAMQRDVED